MLTRSSAPPARFTTCLEAFSFIQMQHPLVDIQKFVIEIPATLPAHIKARSSRSKYFDLDVRDIKMRSLYTVFFAPHCNFRSLSPCSLASTSAPAAPAPSSSTAQATSSPHTPPTTRRSTPSTSAGLSRTPRTGGARPGGHPGALKAAATAGHGSRDRRRRPHRPDARLRHARRRGPVLRPALIWCDQRTQREADWLDRTSATKRSSSSSANPALPNFTLTKLLWVREHQPEIFARIAHVLCPKDYVRFA